MTPECKPASETTGPKKSIMPEISELFVLAASRHGQRKPGVELAPQKLLTFCTFSDETKLDPQLSGLVVEEVAKVNKKIISTNKSPILRPEAVSKTNLKLHDSIFGTTMKQINDGAMPKILTFGGDHSIAIGSISAVSNLAVESLKKKVPVEFTKPELIVFWIDAHADINTPSSTASGNLHGCPVSLLVGLDEKGWGELGCFGWAKERLDSVDGTRENFIQTSRIVYIGLRDVDSPEQEIIDEFKILEYPMPRLKQEKRDIRKIISDSLNVVDPKGEHPIHISFDIDALDPEYAPSTGTPVPDGLTVEEGMEIIKVLGETKRVVSMDLVEVNPLLGTSSDVDETLKSALKLVEQFNSI
jgi:arginase